MRHEEKNEVWSGTEKGLDWEHTWILKVLDWYAAITSVKVAKKGKKRVGQRPFWSLSDSAHGNNEFVPLILN